jgi:hypothetical protein
MANPETAVVTALDALGTLSAFTSGVNIFAGGLPEVGALAPARCIGVSKYGEAPSLDTFEGTRIRVHLVQVMVRGAINELEQNIDDADAVAVGLHNTKPSGFMRCAVRSGPARTGKTKTDNPMASVNLELWEEL